jgi:hypothetical protein
MNAPKGLRRVFEGLSELSARKAAEELNAMKVPTPSVVAGGVQRGSGFAHTAALGCDTCG